MKFRSKIKSFLFNLKDFKYPAKDITKFIKDSGCYISEETVSFILRSESNIEKKTYDIISAVEC